MPYISLNQIIDALSDLDKDQRQLLLNLLQESELPVQLATVNKLTSLEAIREARFHEELNCPKCAAHGSLCVVASVYGPNDKASALTTSERTVCSISYATHGNQWYGSLGLL